MVRFAHTSQEESAIPIVKRALQFAYNVAVIDHSGKHIFEELVRSSDKAASRLLDGRANLSEGRVCFLVPSSFEYVAVQWGAWRAGGVAVPLCTSHPLVEIEYVINDCDAETVVYHPQFEEFLSPLAGKGHGRRFIATTELLNSTPQLLPNIREEQRAMILYTSGTTSRPKGVVSTHANIRSQITSLVEAWGWTQNDKILHVLPLHHIHGIVNVLCCALWSGATCDMLPKFEASAVWKKFIEEDLTLFMAVPTIYSRMIAYWDEASEEEKDNMSRSCRKFRLMVSGSAALPVSVLEKWKKISGQVLLERYGMTEIGMALSNPLHGERRAGCVGVPLPNVEVKLVEDGGKAVASNSGELGEIYVRGPNVFLEYWRRPEITKESFADGWFRTGDVAVQENGYYRILGRSSVDIIKSGGYKVSALEVEEILRTHPAVKECAVVGVEDEYWGERVCAALILQSKQLTLDELKEWAKDKMAGYKIPKQIQIVEELPRNAMGKVTKAEVKRLFQRGCTDQ